jgi:hypothetical protein
MLNHLSVCREMIVLQDLHPLCKAYEKPSVIKWATADLEERGRHPLDLLDREAAIEDVNELWKVMDGYNLIWVYAIEVLEAGVTETLSKRHSGEDSMIVEQSIL